MSETDLKQTYCRICEAACGLLAEVDDHGRVTRLLPDKEHPISQGFMCAKGTRFADVANHPARLLYPQIRQPNGQYRQVSWTEAMATCGAKLQPIIEQHGPHAVAVYYGNPLLFNSGGLVATLIFTRVLGTRNIYSSFSQDCNNKFVGSEIVHGSTLTHPLPDLEHAALGVFFGSNPALSQGSFMHLPGGSLAFERFAKRGGRSIWVDPRRSESARRWGEHLPIQAGQDVFLLLALLHELRDLYQPSSQEEGLSDLLNLAAEYPAERVTALTGITAVRIRQLAQEISAANGCTFHISTGVNMGPFGTLTYISMQALAYLTGNFDAQGGLLFSPMGKLIYNLYRWFGIGQSGHTSRIGGLAGVFDELPGGVLADEILTPGEGQIKALINISGNPVKSIPNSARVQEALASLDCLIHIDLFANDSATTADVLLPATSWLERWDIANTTASLQLDSMLQYGAPVAKPPGETRPERQILADLCEALLERPLVKNRLINGIITAETFDQRLTAVLDTMMWPYQRRQDGRRGLPILAPKAGQYLGRGANTRDKKIRFWSEQLSDEPIRLATHAKATIHKKQLDNSHGLPLTLVCRRRRLGHNSWLHGARHTENGVASEAVAWLNPQDMMRLEVEKGAMIQIAQNGHSVSLPAVPQTDVVQGTIIVPHGLPQVNINRLIPSGVKHIEPISGNHWMTGITVFVKHDVSAT